MKYFWVALILLFALFIRLYQLPLVPNGLYWDEIDGNYQALSLLQTGRDYFGNPFPLFLHSLADYRTPVYMYATVVPTAVFGLSVWSARLPSVIFSLLGLAVLFVISRRLFSFKTSLAVLGVASLTMWDFQFARFASEVISQNVFLLIGLAALLRPNKTRFWWLVSGASFGFASLVYSPAKLFVPLFLLGVIFQYRKFAKQLVWLLIPAILLVGVVYLDGLVGNSSSRFGNVAIFTDPTLAKSIDLKREYSVIGGGAIKEVGLAPRLVDKLWFNKPVELLSWFGRNYLSAFSTDFLFIKGDPNLRHSPGAKNIGQLSPILFLPLILGLYLLKRHKILGWWLILAPVSAALTRDGATHASRLILMLPILLLIVGAGLESLSRRNKVIFPFVLGIFLITAFFQFGYYFSSYRLESAPYFDWGFTTVVEKAVKQTQYANVYIDLYHDSALMAFLYQTKMPPKVFQGLHPLKATFLPGTVIEGQKFDHVYILPPGYRAWDDLIKNSPKSNSLLFVSASQPSVNKSQAKEIIYYPDGTEAFYSIEI